MTVELHATGAGGNAKPVPHRVLIWVTFRDAAGVLWARDPEHRLIEITDEQARTLAAQAEKGMTNGLAPDPGPMDTYALTDEGPYA